MQTSVASATRRLCKSEPHRRRRNFPCWQARGEFRLELSRARLCCLYATILGWVGLGWTGTPMRPTILGTLGLRVPAPFLVCGRLSTPTKAREPQRRHSAALSRASDPLLLLPKMSPARCRRRRRPPPTSRSTSAAGCPSAQLACCVPSIFRSTIAAGERRRSLTAYY